MNVPTAPIDPRDFPTVAVQALCEGGHAGAEYVLTGPASLTPCEQIATIGGAMCRKLGIVEIAPEKAGRELLSVMPAPAITMLMNAWEAASGHPALPDVDGAGGHGRYSAQLRAVGSGSCGGVW